MKIEGTPPYKNAIVASTDSIYFLEHGQAFVNSCRKQENYPHIHIINPTTQAHSLAEKLKVDYTFENTINVSKTYYACNRFLVAPQLLSKQVKLLILDIDCYMNKHFEFFDNHINLGLYIRKPLAPNGWTNRGTKVAAGIVYLTEKARAYIELVNILLQDLGIEKWFVDQVALYEAWEILYKDRHDYIVFDNTHLDWEFTKDSIVWTGKGSRKRNNKTYLIKKKEYENCSI